MAAYLPEEGIVLKQVEAGSKEYEISAAPELIEDLDLKNRVICADAMQTQRQLSVDILAKGGRGCIGVSKTVYTTGVKSR